MTDYLIDPERYSQITLSAGDHISSDEGMCLMEAAAFLAGEQHSDHPQCVSRVLGAFGRALNDSLPGRPRQQLVPLIPCLLGTADDGADSARRWMAADWLVRTWLPTWFDLVPECREAAAVLRGLDQVADKASAKRADAAVRDAERTAWAVVPATVAPRAASTTASSAVSVLLLTASALRVGMTATPYVAAEAWVRVVESLWVTSPALAPTVDALQLSAISLYADMIKAPWGDGA